MYDLMIIGSGPAGISAALTAKARNLNFISCCYRKRNAVCVLKSD